MEAKHNKIVFIGAGNVATALAKALSRKSQILQVYSKSLSSAKKLGKVLGCLFTNDLKKINTEADLYIVADKDDAINKVAYQLHLKNKVIVHTSGSVDIKVLKNTSSNYGVLYPLQTFSKDSGLKKNIPFCIEASNGKVYTQLKELVKGLGGKVYNINSVQRAKLHLAAVFANNFTNYMYTVAHNILQKENIPFDVLLPLINETVDKLKKQSPARSQTGPAIRGDRKTIKRHLKLLKAYPEYSTVYKQLTKSIQHSAHAKKL